MMSIRIDKKKFLPTILVLIIILVSADTVIVGTNNNASIIKLANYSPMILFGFTVIACFVKKKRIVLSAKTIITIFLCGSVLLTFIIKSAGDYIDSYVITIFLLLSALLLTTILPFEVFVHSFENVVYFLCVWSLVTFVLSLISPGIFSLFPKITNKAGLSFANTLFSVVQINTSTSRNFGCFREPGVFQMYINVAIMIHLIKNENIKINRFLVFIASIITTFSTTGYFTLLILFICVSLFKYNFSKKVKALLLISLGLFVFLQLSGQSDQIMYLINKPFNNKDTSSLVRTASIVCNFQIWKSNPILGAGHTQTYTLYQSLATIFSGRIINDNANTVMFLFACYGSLFGAMMLIGTYLFCYRLSNNKYFGLMILLVFLMLYSGENLYRSIFPYLVSMYGLDYLYRRVALSKEQVFTISPSTGIPQL